MVKEEKDTTVQSIEMHNEDSNGCDCFISKLVTMGSRRSLMFNVITPVNIEFHKNKLLVLYSKIPSPVGF